MTLWNTRDKAIQELGSLLKDEAEVLSLVSKVSTVQSPTQEYVHLH